MIIDIGTIDPEILLRLVIAVVAGGLIGFERKKVNKPAGIRTLMIVGMGAALFTVVSITAFANADPARIAAGIVTGIGFLGAGTIFRSKDTVTGLTTAASMWAVGAIGLAAGLGEYVLVTAATILVVLILQLNKIKFLREL
ncbi:magnesium transporter MgtC [Candidatus Woesearchaeota archaeon]|jgi:putative Mg2+ transporter-C (MgtC) family protein|nr:magnesium transporter MgtC [Candidatus Woesearchaeota archaeon]|tara:strand:- start:227 stop:649 length:423 start_codon:yes stop_codon:yes gene_type:complete